MDEKERDEGDEALGETRSDPDDPDLHVPPHGRSGEEETASSGSRRAESPLWQKVEAASKVYFTITKNLASLFNKG